MLLHEDSWYLKLAVFGGGLSTFNIGINTFEAKIIVRRLNIVILMLNMCSVIAMGSYSGICISGRRHHGILPPSLTKQAIQRFINKVLLSSSCLPHYHSYCCTKPCSYITWTVKKFLGILTSCALSLAFSHLLIFFLLPLYD